ncbi:hypothetical protein RvY_14747 [Ramazzottius varieornatus]|uniref:Triple QxxK/R motif-containing protein n=1 Tax=Ramazzottius varieornatus TaxID=947166 RepID=A0A1D1VSD5_RAMVA|nr:hypothetical protein RvY_14747 [Ramazzottius varieornatus]
MFFVCLSVVDLVVCDVYSSGCRWIKRPHLGAAEARFTMVRDARNLKATPVDNYRRKIGNHDKKSAQKDIKIQKRTTDKHRNFSSSVKESWMTVASVLGVFILASGALYGLLLKTPGA